MAQKKVKEMSILALFLAIVIVLTFTQLGFIRIGVISVTIMHVPVIIAAICYGRSVGMKVGLMFGIASIVYNTFFPGVTSFVFSPFVTIGGVSGNIFSVVVALVPRVMIGFVADWLYQHIKAKRINIILASLAGSLANTILVLGGIFLFFKDSYAAATNRLADEMLNVLMGIVSVNGVVEAIIASILCFVVCSMFFAQTSKQGVGR